MPNDSDTYGTRLQGCVDALGNVTIGSGLSLELDAARRTTSTSDDTAELCFPGSFTDFDPDSQYWPSLSSRGGEGMHSREHSGTSKALPVAQHPVPGVLRRSSGSSVQIGPDLRHQDTYNYANHSILESTDSIARNALRDIIFNTIMNDHLHPKERADLLEEYKESSEENQTGLPFRDILSEPMESLGTPPLMFELMSCRPDWEALQNGEEYHGLEVVFFLIRNWRENIVSHGNMGKLSWVVRMACLRRLEEDDGNRLFQYLRLPMCEGQNDFNGVMFDYSVSISHLLERGAVSTSEVGYSEFTAMISLPNFKAQLDQSNRSYKAGTRGDRKHLPRTHAGVVVEFLGAQRAWALEFQSNSLTLELLHGSTETSAYNIHDVPIIHVDAQIKVVSHGLASAGNDEPMQLLFPPSILKPDTVLGPGSRTTTLKPCFVPCFDSSPTPRGLDDSRVLNDELLLLELTLRVSRRPFNRAEKARASAGPSSAVVSQVNRAKQSSVSAAGPSYAQTETEPDGIEDMYISDHSNMGLLQEEMDDWEEISQADETEENDGGWVKASWSGNDEELL